MSSPRRIDVHHHILPPDYARMLKRRGIRPGGIPLPKWSAPAAGRILEQVGVETAILSVSTPGAWVDDGSTARRWARRVNDYTAHVVAQRPHRFGFFATLTLPDVDGAIKEAAYALDVLGADGVVLLANHGGRYLGDPAFDRLLSFLDERRAVVFVHPGELPAEPVPGVPTFTADFLLDTTRTAASLILSGALDRHERISWILAHAGGFVPYIAHRIVLTMLREEPKWKVAMTLARGEQARQAAIDERLAMVRRFHYDIALSSTPTTFPTLLEAVDHDKILFGSDFPFAPAAAVRYMREQYESVDLDPGLRHAIDRGNAERLFPRLADPGA